MGTGGTSKTAACLARDLGAKTVLRVSRRGSGGDVIDYETARTAHADADFLINTTPVGMYPHTEDTPLDLVPFPALRGITDVVYNPLRTRLVQTAAERGIPAAGGLYMLVAQAVAAVEHFLQAPQPSDAAEQIFLPLLQSKTNLVLTGMPGCGKSAVGCVLAEALGRELLDTDAVITERTGLSPAQIIERQGETAFRDIESQAVADCGRRTGRIIPTGGADVLR